MLIVVVLSLVKRNWCWSFALTVPEGHVYLVLEKNKVKTFETDTSEGMMSYFNEENWLFLHVDYNEIVKIEIGAVFSDKDEFDWKF
jgi:hypothetical protein